MGLEKQVSLDVGVVVFGLRQFEGHPLGELLQEVVLFVSDGEVLVFRS